MRAAAEKITRYTYSDYLCWDDKERWEIIDGEAYNMSPAPLIKHQNIAGNLYIKLKTHRKNPCYTVKAQPMILLLISFSVIINLFLSVTLRIPLRDFAV